MTEPARPWLESAYRSLQAAELLAAASQWPQACFNAQQAIELALKAALTSQTPAPPRLHSIAELLARQDATVQENLAGLSDGLRDLDRYYTATRYPDALLGDLPARSDAEDAVAAAKQGVTLIAAMLGEHAARSPETDHPPGSGSARGYGCN